MYIYKYCGVLRFTIMVGGKITHFISIYIRFKCNPIYSVLRSCVVYENCAKTKKNIYARAV